MGILNFVISIGVLVMCIVTMCKLNKLARIINAKLEKPAADTVKELKQLKQDLDGFKFGQF